MHHFDYRNGTLHAENVDLTKLAAEVGTPFYCYSTATLERHYKVFAGAFADVPSLVCYAMKANSNQAVIATLARQGAGADVVSEGELKRALAAGVPPQRIMFSGVGKTARELAAAIDAGILCINVESEPELNLLSSIAAAKGRSDARPIAEVQALLLSDSSPPQVPPRFDEFLATVGGRTQLQIELKQQQTAAGTKQLAASVAEALRAYTGPYTIESFDPKLLVAVRRAGVTGPLGIITYGYDEPDWESGLSSSTKFVLRHLLHWPWTRFAFISCRNVSLELPAVRLFRAFGTPVTAWTITSARDAEAALKHCDQIVFEGFLPASA